MKMTTTKTRAKLCHTIKTFIPTIKGHEVFLPFIQRLRCARCIENNNNNNKTVAINSNKAVTNKFTARKLQRGRNLCRKRKRKIERAREGERSVFLVFQPKWKLKLCISGINGRAESMLLLPKHIKVFSLPRSSLSQSCYRVNYDIKYKMMALCV